MLRLIFPLIIIFLFSCASQGIHLTETQTVKKPSTLTCINTKEIRTYRLLFLLPVRNSYLDGSKLNEDETILSINEYAKPWDIGFTIFGFLFSFNSSTAMYEVCNTKILLAQIASENPGGNPLPHYKPISGGKEMEQIRFTKDDSLLSEPERVKILSMAEKLKKNEEKFQLILVGKTNTSGDIAYQIRLIRKRIEEIKTILISSGFDTEKIHTVYAEKESIESDFLSSVQIYLVKD